MTLATSFLFLVWKMCDPYDAKYYPLDFYPYYLGASTRVYYICRHSDSGVQVTFLSASNNVDDYVHPSA